MSGKVRVQTCLGVKLGLNHHIILKFSIFLYPCSFIYLCCQALKSIKNIKMCEFCLFNLDVYNSRSCDCQTDLWGKFSKGHVKLLVRSMCGHSYARFIPLPVLIMSAFYLLCKARGKEACNQTSFPALNPKDGIIRFGPTVTIKICYFSCLFLI